MSRIIFVLLLNFALYNISAQEIIWASRVIQYSSQYGDKAYSANQVLGEPNGMPFQEKSFVSWTPASRTNAASITVEFPKAIHVQQIGIGENLVSGAISKIILIDAFGNEHIAYQNHSNTQSQPKADSFFNHSIPLTSYQVARLRLELKYTDFKVLPQINSIGISSVKKKIQPKVNTLEYTDYVPKPENLGSTVNSQYHDMLPIISPDNQTLYFARKNAPENLGVEKKDDIYIAQKTAAGVWSKAYNIGSPLNTDEHNFVCAISADGNSMYLANRYDYRTEGQGVAVSHRQKNGSWSKPKALNIINMYNKNKYVCYHLSLDEKVLVMALEREDTYGDMDLYVSFKYADGTWTEPMNMGTDLNTAGAEASIFLAADGKTIYFSSNGYNGYGDLDMYMSKRLDNTWKHWSTPVNLGPNINTVGMDIYYTVPASGEYVYYSSDRGGYGLNDIFRIQLPKQLRPEAIRIDPALYSSYTVETPALKPYQGYEQSAIDKRIEELRSNLDNKSGESNLQYLDNKEKQLDNDIKKLENRYSKYDNPHNHSPLPRPSLPTFDKSTAPQYDASYDNKINELKRQLLKVETSQPVVQIGSKDISDNNEKIITENNTPSILENKALSPYEEKLKKLEEENERKKAQRQQSTPITQTNTNLNNTKQVKPETPSKKTSDPQLAALEEKLKKLEESNRQKKEENETAKNEPIRIAPQTNPNQAEVLPTNEIEQVTATKVEEINKPIAEVNKQDNTNLITTGINTIDTISSAELKEWEQKKQVLKDSIDLLQSQKEFIRQQTLNAGENKDSIQKANENLISEQGQLAISIEQMKMEKEQLALEKEKIENERRKLDLLRNQQYKDINKLKRELDSLENIKAKNTASLQKTSSGIDDVLNEMKKEIGEKVTLKNVYFTVNASFIQARSHSDLDRLVLYLIQNKEIAIEIGGHTNGLCDDAFCNELSTKRANAVKDYLVSKGVASERLTTKGYGKTQNIANNNTSEGRNQNQRVEIKITKVN